ncbi:MAG: 50S ribosomal protein L20 [Candidatus Aceula meridiana]|nr:50S ribosomal protein L20 [Candidatus Aceula meridiana]
MVRVRTAVASRKRKKRVLKAAKGQFGQRSKRYQQARRSVAKGMAYSYRDRRVKKREIKNIWVVRINAACRENDITYSRFINGLKNAEIEINRKMLAEIAVDSTLAFKKLIKIAKEAKVPEVKKVKAAKKE